MTVGVPTLLEEFAVQLKDLCRAAGAAVLVHLEPLEQDNLLLASAGAHSVPELLDSEAAWRFLTEHRVHNPQKSSDGEIHSIVSRDGAGVLIRLPLARILPRPDQSAQQADERRAFPVVHSAPHLDGNLWIALSAAADPEKLLRLLDAMDNDDETLQHDEARLARFVALSARLAWQVYHLNRSLRDPVSHLPGRMEFETFLRRALVAAGVHQQPLGLLLVNPDDFVMVNHRFGRDKGDHAVREIADRLKSCVRETDGVFRYGGAAFAVVLPATALESSRIAADKVRQLLTDDPYLSGELSLEFTIGGAIADLEYLHLPDIDAVDLVQRADTALNQAKLAGGGRLLLSLMSDSSSGLSHFDPLSGIFTTDSEKDYRNMLLLWEAVALVSSKPDPQRIALEFVELLGDRFRPDRLALMRPTDSGGLESLATSVRGDAVSEGRIMGRAVNLGDTQRQLVLRALESGKMERARAGEAQSPMGTTSYVVPLTVSERSLGCLYLDGVNRRLQLDSTDLLFLNALSSQLAVALDRAEMAASWIRDKDLESRHLREELRELKQAIGPSKLVYESQQMKELMAVVTRVAPSDATVLIIGESGTGKEMLAHSVHRLSRRAHEQFVTVDCGAIAHSLLEAELFGHVKGAYTGAESASEGRIAQADGGTIFLDEIGELPLDLQTKLLRFVQEREITPVGGNKTRKVDVRIVAATNRELKDEVANGRFRQDLYYRLQVVAVQAVPLRDRPDDVLPLARTFLERFSVQHDSHCEKLSTGAELKLRLHNWPGNVRELQHTVLRAVLMCDTRTIEAKDIELLPEAAPEGSSSGTSPTAPSAIAAAAPPLAAVAHQPATVGGSDQSSTGDAWAPLREELAQQVEQALSDNASRPVPIGRWLQDDLVLAVSAASGEVARRAARLVSMPESTFRRQLDKARHEAEAGLAARTSAWSRVPPILEALVEAAEEADGTELLDDVRLLLLRIVVEKVAEKTTVGAALMGVTPPTFKRWLKGRAA